MSKGYYYLHTNNELIYKPDYPDVCADLRESDFVKAFWPFDSEFRSDAWTILVEAGAMGAKKERIKELADKWGCDDKDAVNYVDFLGVNLQQDGDKWCCTRMDFENLQESNAGFGDTILEALIELCIDLDFKPTKLNWHADFKMLCKV